MSHRTWGRSVLPRTLLRALTVALAFFSASLLPVASQTERPSEAAAQTGGKEMLVEDIVCWINDDVVTLSDLLIEEQQALAAVLQNTSLSGDALAARVNEARKMVLMQMIGRRLLVQEAERLFDIDAISEDLVDRFMERNQIATEEDLTKLLTNQYQMTRDELEDRLLLMAAPDYVIDTQVRGSLGVSEAEARQYYEQNKDQFGSPGSVVFRELVLFAKSDEEAAGRREEIDKLAATAQAGESFVRLVKEYSEAPSKTIEGKIGPVNPKDLVEKISEAAATLPVGQLSAPIRTAQGWHLIEVLERQDAEAPPFEEVARQCEDAVRASRFEAKYDEYVQELFEDSLIELRGDYVELLPSQYRSMVIVR
ncbi:MAG: peptidyl-prolyl cis-trans isomerase [Acidobacteriota bacterium]|nr:MAG: peptidyl-prolyl cis-trans isomerase [Acidobacteriota bacterium]